MCLEVRVNPESLGFSDPPSLVGSSTPNTLGCQKGKQRAGAWTLVWVLDTCLCSFSRCYLLHDSDQVPPKCKICLGAGLFSYLFYNLIYLFLAILGLYCCMGFLLLWQVGLLSKLCAGFSLCWLLGPVGFSSFGTWAQQLGLPGSRAQPQQLCLTGLVAPRHVGSSWIRDRTLSPVLAGEFFTTESPGKPRNRTIQTKVGR